jgi:energy-coupling factor transporter ATP-binding protein EcfA2
MLKPLVLFTGPDGAGKTTMALMLKKHLEKMGHRVKLARIRGTHTFAYILMLFLRDILELKGSDIHYYRVRVPRRLIGLWIYLEFLSLIPLILWYYVLLRIRYVVVSERSILDALVWVMTSFKDTLNTTSSLGRFRPYILSILRYSKCTVYVTASPEVLAKRKPDEKFLIKKMWIYYDKIAKILKLKYVDTTFSHPSTTLQNVLLLLQKSDCIQVQL